MRKRPASYCFLILLQLFAISLFAQESIIATPEKTNILLGEPLSITITITGGQPYQPVLPDSLGHFEILERMPAKTSTRNGTVTTTGQIVVTSFDSGVQRVPPIAVQGNAAVVSPGFDVVVNTLPPNTKTEYGDLKQIIDLQPPNQWPYIAALALLTLLSAWFIYKLNKKRLFIATDEQTSPVENVSPNNLLKQLEALKAEWQRQETGSLQMGNLLMQIFRRFLLGKGINSTSKTGEEIVLATKTMYDTASWQEIVQTIRLCNAMRFGKYQATLPEGTAGIDAFIKAVTTTNGKTADGTVRTKDANWQPAVK